MATWDQREEFCPGYMEDGERVKETNRVKGSLILH